MKRRERLGAARRWIPGIALVLGCASAPATDTPFFAEVANAIPDQAPNYQAMVTQSFVHTVPVDVTNDGRDDLLLHYWANGVGTNPATNLPCRNRLVILVQQPDGRFLDQTASVLAGDPDLGACSAERRVADVNEDGRPDIVYATSQEDGRDAADVRKMFAPITALVSRPDGRYQMETFGTPNWHHMVGLAYDAQGKVAIVSAGYAGPSEVHQRRADGTWANVSAGYPPASPNSFSFFNATSNTGPSDFYIGNALFPDSFGVAGAWRDVGNTWRSVPSLTVLPVLGTLTLITWSGTPAQAEVAQLDSEVVTSGTFLESCQFRWSPDEPPLTILKLSVKVIPGGYTGPSQVVRESDLLARTRLLAFRLVGGVLERVPLPIHHEERGLESRFFDCRDINGDGHDDIAVYPYSDRGYPLVYLNNRNGELAGVGESPYPAQAERWNIGGSSLLHDFDRDGRMDLLTWPAAGLTYQSGNGLNFHFYRGVAPLKAMQAPVIEIDAARDRGFNDVPISGMVALPSARFDAHGLVPTVVSNVTANNPVDPSALWAPGAMATILRTLPAAASARDWRVSVEARALSNGDVDLYLGIDSNGNGQAEESELACSSVRSGEGELCELAVAAPAGVALRYWTLVSVPLVGQSARIEQFEVPLDVAAGERQLVATGPGSLAADAEFKVRLAWDDARFLPGQRRGGWLQLLASDGASVRWVPVRLNRASGEPEALALESGVDQPLALAAGAAHERLYIDVPPGASDLTVTTASVGNVDLYLAPVGQVAESAAIPTVAPAPARNTALASAMTATGNERLSVASPVAGRWYITPVNAEAGDVSLVVRATVTAVAPRVRSGGYFNPSRSGNGLFVYPAGTEWAGLWYTYLQDGSTTWYYLQAPAPGPNGIWRGSIFRSAWNGSGNRLTKVGEATITPSGTQSFTFDYSLDGQTGSEAYQNFSGSCPLVGGVPLDVSGHWFDPASAGSGYSVQLFPDYEFYLVFGYDTQGMPRYLVAERPGMGGATEGLDLEQLRGACPLCTRTGAPLRSTVGTFTRRIEGGALRNITLAATYAHGVPGTWAANDNVIPLGGLRGCAGQ